MSSIDPPSAPAESPPAALTTAGSAHEVPPADPRRFKALAVIAIAQLMIVLDASIVNLAIPSASADLQIAPANVQWIVTAYTLTFGGFLLLGGRIADYWGRKRTFMVGLGGFALASLIGGLAPTFGLLFTARALQGGFAALLAPAALALISVSFHDPKERAKAFGVIGAISGAGAAIGLLLGGVLTEYFSWRWCLAVNTPIAVVTLLFARNLIRESRAGGNTSYDIPGAITSTLGLVALVYGFTKAAPDGLHGLGELDRAEHLHLVHRRSDPSRLVPRDRGAHVEPSAPTADRPRAQPRWRLPVLADHRRRALRDVPVPWACTCRSSSSTRRCRQDSPSCRSASASSSPPASPPT